MYHFMEDKRRPYVFARNRIIFHSIFSSKLEFLSIIFIGIWIFVVYYSYIKFFFYNGIGEFGLLHRIGLVASYLKGTLDGISFVASGQHLN